MDAPDAAPSKVEVAPVTYTEGGPGPVGTGAWWGVPTGAAFGAVFAVVMMWPPSTMDESGSWLDPDALIGIGALVLFGAFVGLWYGLVVGFIAGWGAWLTPRHTVVRRLVVSGFALATGLVTLQVVALALGGPTLFATPLLAIPLAMAVVAWFLAPRLPDRRLP